MIRLPAEWEQQGFVQYTFPHRNSDWVDMYQEVVACFVNIIVATAQFAPVVVVCHSKKEVSSYFKDSTLFPIRFIEIASNDTWARDHGAITVFENDKPVLLDFIFNGWGQKFESTLDNQISQQLVQRILPKTEVRSIDFVLEGGSIESDGAGTLLTTSECLLSKFRNPSYSKNQIEAFLKQTFGLQKVLWLDHGYLAGDDTDAHIDTLARFCNASTIAYVKCDDPTDEHYNDLQKMESQLHTFTNAQNQAYNLVPLPFPDACYDDEGQRLPATYANFLIVNEGVLVPTYGVSQDETALAILQRIFPERTVIGVDCRVLIEQHGSLHCVSMGYGC